MNKKTINWSAGAIAIACSIGSSYLWGKYVPIKFFSPVTYSLASGAQATLIFILANTIFKKIFKSCEYEQEIDENWQYSGHEKTIAPRPYAGYNGSSPYDD